MERVVSDGTGPISVLVVGSDLEFIPPLADLLELEGYAVLCEHSFTTALHRLAGTAPQPDLLIVDYLVAGRATGADFLRDCRLQGPLVAAVPAILMTAFEPDRLRLTGLDGVRILYKPFHVHRLLGMVGELVRRREQPA
jgi:DNA-binding response OmpR family regulator